jgi:hypothetical protein
MCDLPVQKKERVEAIALSLSLVTCLNRDPLSWLAA